MSWAPVDRDELDDAIYDWMTNSSGTPYHEEYGEINTWDNAITAVTQIVQQ
tara:strand:- start:239 stop:391 length:153 start_codon:yes stop_codon:yes gene_type:complete